MPLLADFALFNLGADTLNAAFEVPGNPMTIIQTAIRTANSFLKFFLDFRLFFSSAA